jgi:hypothetical protein
MVGTIDSHCEHGVRPFSSIKVGEFIDKLNDSLVPNQGSDLLNCRLIHPWENNKAINELHTDYNISWTIYKYQRPLVPLKQKLPHPEG